jgi:hypothetical protein
MQLILHLLAHSFENCLLACVQLLSCRKASLLSSLWVCSPSFGIFLVKCFLMIRLQLLPWAAARLAF